MSKAITPSEVQLVENFYYPVWLRTLNGCSWVFFILYMASILCLLVTSIASSQELLADLTLLKERVVNFGLMALVAIISIGMATAVMIRQPNIRTRHDGFQLFAPPYQSNWLAWGDIKKIKKRHSSSTKRHHTYAVILKGTEISPLYSVLTFAWALDGYRAFILTNRIEHFDRLIALIREKRPGFVYRVGVKLGKQTQTYPLRSCR